MKTRIPSQAGVALPIMLLMVLTMAITSVYLIKSVNSSSINASNASYQSALVRAADFGLHQGFDWLNKQSKDKKAALNKNIAAAAYVATYGGQSPNDAGFWAGSKVVTTAQGEEVRYIIHRMCQFEGGYAQITPVRNSCVMTTHADEPPPAVLPKGASLVQGNLQFRMSPQVHYIITSRLSGPRGGNVINQMVVLIGV